MFEQELQQYLLREYPQENARCEWKEQYLQNAGDEGAKRDSIYEYLKDVLPQNKTEETELLTIS